MTLCAPLLLQSVPAKAGGGDGEGRGWGGAMRSWLRDGFSTGVSQSLFYLSGTLVL